MAQDNQIGTHRTADSEVEIDFFVLLRYLRESWRFVVIVMVVVAMLTAYSLRNTPLTYEASMVVAPIGGDAGTAGGNSTLSLTSVLNTLGAGGSSSPQFDQFQYKITSPSVVRAANADGQLYAWIYPGLWDAKTRSWNKPHGFSYFLIGMVRAFFHKPDWIAPDDVMTANILQKQVLFEAIPRSSLNRVSYQNQDPSIATAMLRRLFTEADRQIRDQERRRLKAQIANANDVLATIQFADLRTAMAQQLAQSQYRLMTVPDNIDYSARQVEPPFVSSMPVAPKVGISLAIAIAVAFLVSSFAAVAYRITAAEKTRRGEPAPGADIWDAIVRRVRGPVKQ